MLYRKTGVWMGAVSSDPDAEYSRRSVDGARVRAVVGILHGIASGM